MSPPVGATGIQTCNDRGPNGEEQPPARRFRVGAAFGAFSSTLKLTGHDVDIAQRATTVSLDVRTSDRLTLQGGLGAVIGGTLKTEGQSSDVKPGFLFSFGVGYRFLDGQGAAPFILGSLSYAMSFSHTQAQQQQGQANNDAPRVALTTGDVRAGIAVGKTFFDILSPYLVARVFGGPVWWSIGNEKVSGGDRYHYQVGAGLAVVIAGVVDAFVEGVPLGERRVAVGIGVSF